MEKHFKLGIDYKTAYEVALTSLDQEKVALGKSKASIDQEKVKQHSLPNQKEEINL